MFRLSLVDKKIKYHAFKNTVQCKRDLSWPLKKLCQQDFKFIIYFFHIVIETFSSYFVNDYGKVFTRCYIAFLCFTQISLKCTYIILMRVEDIFFTLPKCYLYRANFKKVLKTYRSLCFFFANSDIFIGLYTKKHYYKWQNR